MIIHSISLFDASSKIIDIIRILDKDFFPFPWTNKQWLEAHKKSSFHLFYHSELRGFALFQLSPAEELAHLLKILINPSTRGVGLASQIMNASHQNLRVLGFKRAFLEVESENVAAIGLYDKLGYKKIHYKKKFYSNGADAHIMEKLL